jgi:ferrous iron transport protein A
LKVQSVLFLSSGSQFATDNNFGGTKSVVPPKTIVSTQEADAREAETILLAVARRASTVRVVAISGGRGSTSALEQLGIRPGETLSVRRTAPLGGPILVEGRGGRVAIGRGLARKVKVRVIS